MHLHSAPHQARQFWDRSVCTVRDRPMLRSAAAL